MVTGQEFYRFYRLDGAVLKPQNVSINKRDSDVHFSTNYTCHAWMADGRFVICNDHGQIFLLDQAGEYKGITIGDPKKEPFPIHSITTYSGSQGDASGGAAAGGKGGHKSGFIVAGESGRIRVFVKSDADPKKPYVRVDTSDDLYPDLKHYKSDKKDGERDNSLMDRMVYDDIDIHKVTALSLAPSED